MAYTATIPASTDIPSASQALLLANFAAINTVVGVNHVAFNASGEGKHKWVSLPVQGASPPAASFAAGEVGLYSFVDPTTLKNELYVNKTNQITATQIPATASQLSIKSAAVVADPGWTYLPSGILLRFGAVSVGSGSGVVTSVFNTGVGVAPVFNNVLSVQLTLINSSTSDVNISVRLIDFTAAQFRWFAANRTTGGAHTGAVAAHYLAIGY